MHHAVSYQDIWYNDFGTVDKNLAVVDSDCQFTTAHRSQACAVHECRTVADGSIDHYK